MGWFRRKWEFAIVPEHSNALVAIFSGLLFLATTVYTVFAAFQWQITKRVMLFEERALIYEIQFSDMRPMEVGQPIGFQVRLANTGKTIARDVIGKYRIEILDGAAEPTFDYSPDSLNNLFQGHAWFMGQGTNVGVAALREIPGTKTVEPIAVTQELIDKFNARQIWFAVEGTVTYHDEFGGSHWITICHSVFKIPPGGFLQNQPNGTKKCAEYNDADTN
jgi:hypothetical protein